VDPEVARLQEPARGMQLSVLVDEIQPMERFSFRWHPFAIDPGHDIRKSRRHASSSNCARLMTEFC
jgi:hypothetical protein